MLDAGQAVAAEGIVLVEDRDAGEVQILGQMLDPGLGLGAVAGANVDDVVQVRRAEKFGPGERTDERHVPRAFEIGTVAIAVGVPTAPISANTLSSSISLLVCTIERSGS